MKQQFNHYKGLRPCKGFTLIELLVVLLIVSIIASVSIFSLANNSQDILKNEAKRFTALFQMAIEQALLRNETYGIHISETDYAFYEYSQRNWHPINEKPFTQHRVDKSILMRLYIESIGVTLTTSESENSAKPQLWISSSHEVSPFSIEFSNKQHDLISYSVDAAGKVITTNKVL
ncbi:MAG: type II secretion system minor pseudopilin GspH [Gammaproteobacteria bacterium]|nr:type II secretion system minor pseudopilin GspH [Gammaproteobacteria bacterium]